jgi:OmcA/MtrC family decaheme c-type cytochrome
MKIFKHKHVFLVLALLLILPLMFVGCKGSDGDNGANGANGTDGTNGTNGKDLTTGTVDAASFTFDDLRDISLGGKILSATTAGNQPVVTFQVTNTKTGEGIRGLRTFSLHIAQLNPVANGSSSYWLNYITSSSTSNGSFRPTTDPVTQFDSTTGAMTKQGYSVVDNNDGTYVVTFGSNIKSGSTGTFGSTYYNPASATYNGTLTHRIVVGVRSVVVPGVVGLTPGAYAGPINPITGANFGQFTNTNGVNFAYDFVPSTGAVLAVSARDIVTIDACNQCHYKIQYGSNNTSGHFGSRTDTKTCVMCHTPQNIVSGQTATTNGDFTPFIHKIHMGERLPLAETQLGINLNEVTYPQDIRNCTHCHKGANTDNWKTQPTRKACGACHNDVDFTTGANHTGGIRLDDSACTLCHDETDIATNHVPIATPDPTDPRLGLGGTNTHTNAEYIAATGVVPAGANKITWVISSVTVSGGIPSIKFKFQKDGADVVFTAPTSTASELMSNFAGSPSAYFVWAETQDGITAPADFNKSANSYIRNVWNGTVSSATATITGPVGGYYTFTRTGTTIPAGAKMLTGGIGYSYGSSTPPLVQTNLAAYPYTATTSTMFSGGLAVPAPNVYKVATGYTGRRIIVDTNKCNTCHSGLGVEPTFHVGQRNDAPTCSFCHNPGRASQGWTVNASTFVHAIHSAAKRTVPFKWDSVPAAGDEPETGFFDITYPGRGILKNCELCHVAGGYDFSSSMYTANSGAQDVSNMLLSTTMTSSLSSSSTSTPSFSPYITLDFDYGAAGAGTNLVNSPIAAACFACHDTDTARSHMEINGGSIYATRTTALATTETCLVCHGSAANTAYGDYVPAIKSVHRWW